VANGLAEPDVFDEAEELEGTSLPRWIDSGDRVRDDLPNSLTPR
jgi:hypothetical protein